MMVIKKRGKRFQLKKMAKSRSRRKSASRRCMLHPRPSKFTRHWNLDNTAHSTSNKKIPKSTATEPSLKKDWEDATCSVCMEYPHNAVLLLCSSHDKGCRPFMCGTSRRFSNCLDQFKKAHAKARDLQAPPSLAQVGSITPSDSEDASLEGDDEGPVERWEVGELVCPLCRGQVKGWTVVEPARAYLNLKHRGCMEEGCGFTGTYRDLRRHVELEHPCSRPCQVDPERQRDWRRFERERDREDVMSTIRSTMPGAVVLGDYVIEGGEPSAAEDGNWLDVLLLFQALGPAAEGAMGGGRNLSSRLRRLAMGRHRGGIVGMGSTSGLGEWGEGSDSDDFAAGPFQRRRRRTRRRALRDMH
ncbi:uncharacterized protein LOC18423184 isoform X2 [Amborella trichopoda]|uniref:uncharacterized protein LOC18423184 isoform X2 n=1 Tax=Amborella trichopoda TaxID=13333 RepID=UPI0009C120F7|nr:uncharacterized protein LOC18423184 isoform X2 [Amborella trichopoda]XP_020528167.1 uncharacterized protein LOC18423184 isoform X2 [Amborella trichopoda]|eukprot:XP_020528164.1 uncharacterized protein LOC18423184 isoform X2 [Amborella trichopoda]